MAYLENSKKSASDPQNILIRSALITELTYDHLKMLLFLWANVKE